METLSPNLVLDVRSLSCPLPIIRTKRAMATMKIGEVIEVLVCDPGSLADFPAWTEMTGHTLLQTRQEGDIYIFDICRTK